MRDATCFSSWRSTPTSSSKATGQVSWRASASVGTLCTSATPAWSCARSPGTARTVRLHPVPGTTSITWRRPARSGSTARRVGRRCRYPSRWRTSAVGACSRRCRSWSVGGGAARGRGPLERKFWANLGTTVGRPHLIERQYEEGRDGEAVHKAFEELFASRTRAEWEKELAGCDACCEPVLELDEVMSHPQVAARQKSRRVGGDAPRLGEHTAVVLAELGIDASRYEGLQRQG